MELLGHMVILQLSEELPNCYAQRLYHFTFTLAMHEGSDFSTASPTLIMFHSLFKNCHHPTGCEVVFHCGSALHFPKTSDVEHLESW